MRLSLLGAILMACTAYLPAHAQSLPDTDWRFLGTAGDMAMIIRAPKAGTLEARPIEVMYLYAPHTQPDGLSRTYISYTVNCAANTVRDHGGPGYKPDFLKTSDQGPAWKKEIYAGEVSAASNGAFHAAPPNSILAAIITFACKGEVPDTAAPTLKWEAAMDHAHDVLNKKRSAVE